MPAGLAFRNSLSDFIYHQKGNIGLIEITADNFLPLDHNHNADKLKQLANDFEIVIHGISLSIASPRLSVSHLTQLKILCDLTSSPYYSDHLAISAVSDISLGHFSPLFYSKKLLQRLINNINKAQDFLERPVLLENISYHFYLNETPYVELDFLNELVEKTNCGILLDVANLHANATNHGFDPYCYIDRINKDKIASIHIAGGDYDKTGYLYDSHGNLVEEKTWQLLEYLCKYCSSVPIILEYDRTYPDEKYLLMELNLVSKILDRSNRMIC